MRRRRHRSMVIALVVALGAGCTSSDREMVDPPDIPASSEVWVDPMFRKFDPPFRWPSPQSLLFALGERLVFLRVMRAEAEAGHRVSYYREFDERRSWVAGASEQLCAEQGCADGCVAEMRVPRRACGTGLGEGDDFFSVEVSGCGPKRRFAYSVRYDPLRIVKVIAEGVPEEDIPEDDLPEEDIPDG